MGIREDYINSYDLDQEVTLFADGYDDCILGVLYMDVPVIAYDTYKIINKLAEDMTREEAEEFFDFNIAGAHVGPYTPVFVYALS